jgi:hypothetical protein
VRDEAQPLGELPQHVAAVVGGGIARELQAAVQPERDIGGGRRHPEADRPAEGGDENAGDGRPDHAAGLPRDGAERDRIREPLPRDELRDERHAARLVEGPEGAAQRGHDEQVLDAGQPEDGEHERHGQRHRDRDLRHEQEPQPVDAIREDAAAELEEDERHALGQPEIAEGQRVPWRPPT